MRKKVSGIKKKIAQLKRKISQFKKRFISLRKVKKGFTLIELLAVITIMGVLLLIAISGVSVLVTRSRIRTLAITIDSYAESVAQEMISNTELYKFNERENTIYALPIECVLLEEGGTDPFGEWLQASDAYWAYVLVQWDYDEEEYIYGFTFKDSGGYGLYPTSMEKLNENKSKIKYRVDLRKPESGSYLNVAEKERWTGFKVNDETMLIVLEASKEGQSGDGEKTCTLCQKGSNYDEDDNDDKLLYNIVKNSTLTNQGKQYIGKGYNDYNKNVYFYNDPAANNVLFADYCWKVIRTTGTGGVKLMYNGEPVDGVCDNSGSDTQIGTTEFSEFSSSLADVGYMGGFAYDYEKVKYGASGNMELDTESFKRNWRSWSSYSSEVYAEEVKYENGTYTLVNPTTLSGSADIQSRNNKYTCFSTGTSCTSVYYVFNTSKSSYSSYNYMYFSGIKLSSGQLLSDKVMTASESFTTDSDGKFTLSNPRNIDRKGMYSFSDIYFCPDTTSTSCDELYSLSSVSLAYNYDSNSIKTRKIKVNYSNYSVDLLFGDSFSYDGDVYKLKNTSSVYNWKTASDSVAGDKHYTCLDDNNTCETLYYLYNIDDNSGYYVPLQGGASIDDAKKGMLNYNDYNSYAKEMVEAWYEYTMTEYTSRLEDTVYCNNRIVSTPGGWSSENNDFSTHLKFYSFDNNDLTCGSKADQFTVSSSIGNGELKYPVGLITAPEAKLWGSRSSGTDYWTMSPFGYGEAAGHVFKVFYNGIVDFDRVTYSNGIRPVVSLKPGTIVSGGNGTVETPYIIE